MHGAARARPRPPLAKRRRSLPTHRSRPENTVPTRGAAPPEGARWRNLVFLVLAAFYGLYTAGSVWTGGLFGYVGTDYRAFRASAQIVLERGFAQVYDLSIQEQYQRPLYEAYVAEPLQQEYATVPVPYLPAFIPLFLPLALLPAVPGFLGWTVLNLALLALYLWRFGRVVGIQHRAGLLTQVLLALPVFANLIFGQVSSWLLFCLAEFLLVSAEGREFRGGLWLGGLLLKPQCLFLILPGLLIGRRFKAVAGSVVAGLAILAVSAGLVGIPGLITLARLILLYPGELATTNPQLMMNWRALAINLGQLLPPAVAWCIAIAGLVATAGAALALWLRPAAPDSPQFVLALLGTYAATCAVAWHSHWHMAIPLLAPLLWLWARGRLPQPLLDAWLLVPGAVFLGAFLVLMLAAPGMAGLDHNLAGLSLLAVNLTVLGWALRARWRPGPAAASGGVV